MLNKFLYSFLFFACCYFISVTSFSQGIRVGQNNDTPDPSAGLEVDFNDKGLLMPRMTTAERNQIQSPANGLMIWNTSSNCLDVYVVNTWQSLTCGCSEPPESPMLMNGSASVCAGSANNVYSINPVEGATAYIWAIPIGATITAGSGTTAIAVTFGSESGDVSVKARNNCGDSPANTVSVTVDPILSAGISIAADPQ
ncbi:MAG: hypothetical protein IT223_02925, partial [Crocinitomicaceae bacterium]|nr:hypothetical protein [Crocinitomicaceae bacterium]